MPNHRTGTTLSCAQCGCSFYVRGSRVNKARFCSYSCSVVDRLGKPRSPETRAKLSAAHTGKKLSLEHRAKLSAIVSNCSLETRAKTSASQRALWSSPEYRERQTAAMRAAWTSSELREKMSLAKRGRKNGPPSLETREKISVALTGKKYGPRVPVSPETCEKIAASKRGKSRPPEARAAMSAAGRARMLTDDGRALMLKARKAAQELSGPTSIERAVGDVLTALGIEFIAQYPIKPYFTDFFLPTLNLILECDGDYWHRTRGEYDAKRDRFITDLGFSVVRLPERTIRSDALRAVTEALRVKSAHDSPISTRSSARGS